MPWLDTPRSGFKTALEYFWNSWGCTQEDLVLIVCGSATSWLVKNLLMDTGGLYDRVTRVIDLQPFTLAECSEFYEWQGIGYSTRQVVESYMTFGGVPYYLGLQERGQSLAQNIERLVFQRGGQLKPEFDRLYATLFRRPGAYVDAVRALARRARMPVMAKRWASSRICATSISAADSAPNATGGRPSAKTSVSSPTLRPSPFATPTST